MVFNNGDACIPTDFVLVQRRNGTNHVLNVGQFVEIVKAYIPQAPVFLPSWVLVNIAVTDQKIVNHYHMPYYCLGVKKKHWEMMPFQVGFQATALFQPHSQFTCSSQDIFCTANMQHLYFNSGCTAKGNTPVFQERRLVQKTRPIVEYKPPHNIYVLNTARMRDAHILQHFWMETPSLDCNQMLYCSAKALAGDRISGNKKKQTKRHLDKLPAPTAPTQPVARPSTLSFPNIATNVYHAPSNDPCIGGMQRKMICANPAWQKKHSQHDCVLVERNSDQEGFRGLEVAQVLCFVSSQYQGELFEGAQ